MIAKDIKPLVILDKDNGFFDLAFSNQKSYNKSLENKSLWIVHEETGRVLPYMEDTKIITLKDYPKYVIANIDSAKKTDAKEKNSEPAEKLPEASGVLASLKRVISERKKNLPEGSYTTHLFKSGISKIRKKLGEEAVELILAEKKEEIIYESADLIYHLLVLLEEKKIGFGQVLRELEKRGK